MTCPGFLPLPQLEKALFDKDTKSIEIIRRALNWNAEYASHYKRSSDSADPMYKKIIIMLQNFGPSCLYRQDSEGNTLMHKAAIESTDDETLRLIYYIDKHCTDYKSIFFTKGKSGYTVFESAATNPCNKPLKYLVKVFGTRVVTEKETEAVHLSALYQGADSMEFIKDEIGASCFYKQFRTNKRNVFHYAAMNTRSQDALIWLIKDIGNAPLKVKDVNGNTPVHLAALTQGGTSMQLIYHKLGSEMMDMKGQDGETIVHCAARNEITNSALLWCAKKLTLQKNTPLYLQENTALNLRQNFTLKDKLDRMPIHHVAMWQDEAALKMVVEAIGKKSLCCLGENEMSVVHYAAMNTKTPSTLRWLVEELGSDSLIHQRDSAGKMPIHLVAMWQDEAALKMVVDAIGKESLFNLGENEMSVVHYAAMNTKTVSTLRWIMEELGSDSLIHQRDSAGRMPIHLVAMLQNKAALKMVVEAIGKESLCYLGENEMSVVHYAAMNTKTLSTLRWIVEELGSDCLIHQRDSAGRRPIHLAALHQGLKSLEFIFQLFGPSIFDVFFDLVCDKGRNIAHYAAENVNKEELMQFIQIKADFLLNLPDKNGDTADKLASI